MTFGGLLRFAARRQRLAREVFTCYEAGVFGYHLHRKLVAMGVTNYVVQPQDWDERGKGVKNDRLVALALCRRLDRFTPANAKPSVSCVCRARTKNVTGLSPGSAIRSHQRNNPITLPFGLLFK